MLIFAHARQWHGHMRGEWHEQAQSGSNQATLIIAAAAVAVAFITLIYQFVRDRRARRDEEIRRRADRLRELTGNWVAEVRNASHTIGRHLVVAENATQASTDDVEEAVQRAEVATAHLEIDLGRDALVQHARDRMVVLRQAKTGHTAAGRDLTNDFVDLARTQISEIEKGLPNN